MKTKDEIIKYLKKTLKDKEKTGMATTPPTPLEQAQVRQQKRAKERHNYLLRDYKV